MDPYAIVEEITEAEEIMNSPQYIDLEQDTGLGMDDFGGYSGAVTN